MIEIPNQLYRQSASYWLVEVEELVVVALWTAAAEGCCVDKLATFTCSVLCAVNESSRGPFLCALIIGIIFYTTSKYL